MKYLLSNNLKEPFQIKKNINVVSGQNGIGKSYFFAKPFQSFNVIDVDFIKNIIRNGKEESILTSDDIIKFIKKENMYLINEQTKYWEAFSQLDGDGYKIIWNNNLRYKKITPVSNYMDSYKANAGIVSFAEWTNFKIINLNKEMELATKNNFDEFLKKFKKAFAKYGMRNLTSDLRNSNQKYSNSKIVRIIKTINQFLNNKEIEGLNEGLSGISFIDNNSLKRESTDLTPEILSDGEKKLFALSAIFLENEKISDDTKILYLWDEPENSLHANWQKEILNFLKLSITKANEYIVLISHSSHIVLQALLDQNIELIKFTRDSDVVSLKTNKDVHKQDQDFRNMLNLGYQTIKILVENLGKKTLIVEGEVDKMYLDLILGDATLGIDIKIAHGGG